MSKESVYRYVNVSSRPKKRKVQRYFYELAAGWLEYKRISVIDLPSTDLRNFSSIQRMRVCGLRTSKYFAYEQEPDIFNQISCYSYQPVTSNFCQVSVKSKDVIKNLDKHHDIGLFNLDFCQSLDLDTVNEIIKGIANASAERSAVIITYSPRTPNKPTASEALTIAFEHNLPYLGVLTIYSIDIGYKDTAPMKSRLYLLRKEDR